MSLVTRERRGSAKETERQLVVVLVGDKAKDDEWIWEFSGSLLLINGSTDYRGLAKLS
jgi:hypothetical protein